MCKNIFKYIVSLDDDTKFDLAMNDIRTGSISSAHPSVALFIKRFYKYKDCTDTALLKHQRRIFLELLSRSKHVKQIANLNRGEARGAKSINAFIDSLFDRKAKLLLVRVDLYYDRQKDSQKADRNFDEIIHDRDIFLQKLRRDYNHLFGYLWKLEYKESRGYLLHMLVIFDGNKVQNDIVLGKALGTTWIKLNKTHTYWNCNADKQKYEEWGTHAVGKVHYADTDKIDNLKNYVISHLVKMDPYLIARMPRRFRTYGKSEVPMMGIGGRPRDMLISYKPHISKNLWY